MHTRSTSSWALAMLFCLGLSWLAPVGLQAEELLQPQTQSEANLDVQSLFEKALRDREAGRYQDSILAFQTILNSDPALHRARLELAVAYFKTLQFQEAIAEAKKVLQDPKTPPNVRVTILAFIAEAEKGGEVLASRNGFRFPLSFGYLYDSNVNAGPSATTIPGGGIITPEAQPKSDHAYELSGGMSHNLQTGRMFLLGDTPAMLLWQSSVNLYDRNYLHQDDYDLRVLSFTSGPSLIARNTWRTNLAFQADIIDLGSDELANFVSILPTFTWHFPHSLEATAAATIQWRNYKYNHPLVALGRDSSYIAPKISLGWVSPGKRFAVQGGIELFNEHADSEMYSNDGTFLFTGVNWQPLDRTSIFVSYRQRDLEYDGILAAPFNVARDETQRYYIVGAKHTIESENPLFDKWTVEFKVTRIRNEANTNLYDYKRRQYSLTFSRAL